MYCKECGNQLPDDAKFCGKCGNNVMRNSEVNEQQENNMLGGGRKTLSKGVKAGIAGILIIVLVIGIFNILRYETVYVLVEYEHNFSSADGEQHSYSYHLTYDENGNCIAMIDNDEDGDRTSYKYTYDKSGNCIKEIAVGEDGQIDYSDTHEWVYAENGNTIEYFSYDDDGQLYIDGKLILSEKYIETYDYYGNSEDSLYFSKYEYDETGSVLKTSYFDDGFYETYYDEQYNVLNEKHFNENGIMDHQSEYEYDLFGNVSKMIYSSQDESENYEWVYERTYDDNGNILSETRYQNDILKGYAEFSYDSKGNVLSKIYYDENHEQSFYYHFIYDENGNCIEENCNDLSFVTRKYEALRIPRKNHSFSWNEIISSSYFWDLCGSMRPRFVIH